MLDRDPLGANFVDFNPDEYQSYLARKKDVDLEPDFETTGLDEASLYPDRVPVYRGPEDTDFYSQSAPEWRNFDYQPDEGDNGAAAAAAAYQPAAVGDQGRNLVEELQQGRAWPPGEDAV